MARVRLNLVKNFCKCGGSTYEGPCSDCGVIMCMACEMFRKVTCCNKRLPGWLPGYMTKQIDGLVAELTMLTGGRAEKRLKEFAGEFRNCTVDMVLNEITLVNFRRERGRRVD